MHGKELAQKNFDCHLQQNSYPGRGLTIGRASSGNAWMIIYWIMGRSANSRNRRFVADGTTLRTAPVDVSTVKEPGLIIYESMLEFPGIYLVSNGDQTRTLYETLKFGGSFDGALAGREREPDAPNFTPRISGMLNLQQTQTSIMLSILKANPFDSNLTDRFTYRPALPPPGFGVGLTTYQENGDPLPSFKGDPLILPCPGNTKEVLDYYWHALDNENLISMAVKWIPMPDLTSKLVIRNRYGD
ncbi:MAG: inosine monophosphate cyclohydrolase [Chloroflexi bacterium]|nr:inosine monophosphate cyclohydrolase [Chloroflexota bacterium]